MNLLSRVINNLRYKKVLIVKYLDVETNTIHLIGTGWIPKSANRVRSVDDSILRYNGKVIVENGDFIKTLDGGDFAHLIDWNAVAFFEGSNRARHVILNGTDDPTRNHQLNSVMVPEDEWKVKSYGARVRLAREHVRYRDRNHRKQTQQREQEIYATVAMLDEPESRRDKVDTITLDNFDPPRDSYDLSTNGGAGHSRRMSEVTTDSFSGGYSSSHDSGSSSSSGGSFD